MQAQRLGEPVPGQARDSASQRAAPACARAPRPSSPGVAWTRRAGSRGRARGPALPRIRQPKHPGLPLQRHSRKESRASAARPARWRPTRRVPQERRAMPRIDGGSRSPLPSEKPPRRSLHRGCGVRRLSATHSCCSGRRGGSPDRWRASSCGYAQTPPCHWRFPRRSGTGSLRGARCVSPRSRQHARPVQEALTRPLRWREPAPAKAVPSQAKVPARPVAVQPQRRPPPSRCVSVLSPEQAARLRPVLGQPLASVPPLRPAS